MEHFLEQRMWKSIFILLLIDVICIFGEIFVHDPHFADDSWPHPVSYVLKVISLSILCVFQVEAFLAMAALGSRYFHHWAHIFDAVVIAASIFFEVLLGAAEAGLLVILRFWRLVRIAHGVYEANMQQMHKFNQLKELEVEELQRQLKRLRRVDLIAHARSKYVTDEARSDSKYVTLTTAPLHMAIPAEEAAPSSQTSADKLYTGTPPAREGGPGVVDGMLKAASPGNRLPLKYSPRDELLPYAGGVVELQQAHYRDKRKLSEGSTIETE